MILYMHLRDGKPAAYMEWEYDDEHYCTFSRRVSGMGKRGINSFATSYDQMMNERLKVKRFCQKRGWPIRHTFGYIRLVIPNG